MEMRAKLKAQEKTNSMRKQVNFNINHLRGDTQKLLITDDSKERISIGKLASDIAASQITTRADDGELWAKV